ncbi:MAG: hypothetical protein KGS61_07235 [Verrucomicrobia bacterium]|nr:hypothetical protein [Verrucomicrobiota bacterium]
MSHPLHLRLRSARLFLGTGFALLAGCRPSSGIPATPAEAQAAIQRAFQNGDPKAQALASNVVTAIQNRKSTEAFLDLSALTAAPGLTEPQRIAAAQARATLGRELRRQADQGDKEAAQLLQMYQSSR